MKKLSLYIIFIAIAVSVVFYSIREMDVRDNPIKQYYNQIEQVINEAGK